MHSSSGEKAVSSLPECTVLVSVHGYGQGSPNQCVAKNTETVTLSQTGKGTYDGSRAITEINGIHKKLNGDCPVKMRSLKMHIC